MIVCGHDDERHLFHCGNVHSFMERASLHPALTDACQADKVFFTSESFRHQCAHGDRNHRAEVADHRKFVVARVTSMNVAVASTHRPEARAQYVRVTSMSGSPNAERPAWSRINGAKMSPSCKNKPHATPTASWPF